MADQQHAAGRLAAHAAALDPVRAHAHALAPHQPPQMYHAQAPQQQADMSNWAADFARQSNQRLQQRQQHPQHQPAPAAAMQNGFAPGMQMNFQAAFAQQAPMFGGPMYAGPMNGVGAVAAAGPQRPTEADFDQEMSRWMATHGGGSAAATTSAGGMADVDAVMDQMAKDLETAEQEASAAQESRQRGGLTLQPDNQHFTDLDTPEIGNLSLEPQVAAGAEAEAAALSEELQQLQQQKSRSEVSEAAERLLESVQHEDGEKWKNSVFLSLMRDFRDGRKDIVDNEIRETDDDQPQGQHEGTSGGGDRQAPAPAN
jgi:hypothetical protein